MLRCCEENAASRILARQSACSWVQMPQNCLPFKQLVVMLSHHCHLLLGATFVWANICLGLTTAAQGTSDNFCSKDYKIYCSRSLMFRASFTALVLSALSLLFSITNAPNVFLLYDSTLTFLCIFHNTVVSEWCRPIPCILIHRVAVRSQTVMPHP